jgi:hypothetical protein
MARPQALRHGQRRLDDHHAGHSSKPAGGTEAPGRGGCHLRRGTDARARISVGRQKTGPPERAPLTTPRRVRISSHCGSQIALPHSRERVAVRAAQARRPWAQAVPAADLRAAKPTPSGMDDRRKPLGLPSASMDREERGLLGRAEETRDNAGCSYGHPPVGGSAHVSVAVEAPAAPVGMMVR